MIGAKHLNPNIITTSDCEAAGEVFTLTNMLHKTNDLPMIKDTNQIDYTKDFFEKQAFLTVSSQLQLELLCAGLSKVWTSNKSFRSEKSKTTRHLAEFEHIEWEFAWIELGDLMDLSEHYTQYCFQNILDTHIDDLQELNKFTKEFHIKKIGDFLFYYLKFIFTFYIQLYLVYFCRYKKIIIIKIQKLIISKNY